MLIIGLIAILLSLVLPLLASMHDGASNTRSLSQVRQNAALLSLYAADYDGVFPLWNENPVACSLFWNVPIVAAGYATSTAELDPSPACRELRGRQTEAGVFDMTTYAMSMCLVYDPDLMVRGHTVPVGSRSWRAVPTRDASILFPAGKGVMYQGWIESSRHRTNWCCVDTPLGVVAMADGSALAGEWTDFLVGELVVVDGIGVPVKSTWDGVRGRDR
jgi:hypothetical protein